MFSPDKVNSGRQPELDIARGLAVLFMIIIHVQLVFANAGVWDTLLADINDFNGDIPAAPMFMFLLGIGINYSRKNQPASMAWRGLALLCTAYLLSFVRGFIPNVIMGFNSADISYLYKGFNELMIVDILQFSGLAMIMFAGFNFFKFNKIAIGITGLVFALINILLLPVQTQTLPVSSLAGLFWGSNESSYFPFLTWAFYPIAGYIFGDYLIRCTDKRKFYLISGVVAAVVFFFGIYLFNFLFSIPTGMNLETGYYHHILTDNITFTGGVIFELAILSYLVRYVPGFIKDIAGRWSKNVTPIYCIHWVIISWLTLAIPGQSLSMASFIVLTAGIVVVSDVLATIYANWKAGDGQRHFSSTTLILVGALLATMLVLFLFHK
ncbi:heparan-alpha-glucosaminide N-acetyltransferase domain-containing protein [Aeromonas sp. L_1B5_3]|uniref:heparan-alpha-glucosaminide N-acetyltransferase domain-containing protein n=1 Tax=Aeromonas sp. L_1B5_3 TaxID=1588629 RepID=UPI0005B72BA1|nr:heparan-alpha-glucosaminide N-acetyltransferase domain-containing protein [Aeromonas sp. L_1B5_3]KIQ81894.1 hypothetical protein RW26_08015 [Aeromonas sp. L_1B5_3]